MTVFINNESIKIGDTLEIFITLKDAQHLIQDLQLANRTALQENRDWVYINLKPAPEGMHLRTGTCEHTD